ncbi:MAG: DUF882 domain-containing protein [Proteobacteria bacterium]|nr:DUF882 domain-containing protein [Pseudomonadota bacterium]MBU0967219.1 DUF882 domain-containing protein [Pseudomonadota bacterium]
MNGFQHSLSRRGFITLGLITALSSAIPFEACGAVRKMITPERSLSFYSTHTGEKLRSIYWCQGRYVPGALADINRILRDHRTGDIKKIDTKLLDLLYVLHGEFGTREPFHIISGYRSPKTNSILRKRSRGVAKNSMHTCGKAVDIRLPGRKLENLLTAAVELKKGGVGYYPESEFIHVDVGRVRYW